LGHVNCTGVIDLNTAEPARRPRLEDVAAAVGMSMASVSLVLRGAPGPSSATRTRVLEAANLLGYRPDRTASLLARRRSRLIGVVMDVSNTFHAQLIEAVHEAADRHGYDLVLSTVTHNRDETRAVETLLDFRCEALVLLGSEASPARLNALDRQLPVVVVGRPLPSGGVDVVRAADDQGVAEAVEYVAGLGHRRIAYVDGGRGAIATGRRRGYQQAMRRQRLGTHIQVIPGNSTEESGARAGHTLLDADPPPTAVLAYNDRSAVGLIDSLVRAGVDIPGDMSVVGYDDSPLSRLTHIDLTTVSQSPRELSEHAVAAVVERLDGGRTERREVVVGPKLVVRGTTGPVPELTTPE
jgi:DNA-binding LacI/PurR family transcriptional regulator